MGVGGASNLRYWDRDAGVLVVRALLRVWSQIGIDPARSGPA